MVRIKHRYLLVQILYPASSEPAASHGGGRNRLPSVSAVPDAVHFHQPTSDRLTAHLLTRSIRSEIAALYGDYGVGVTATRLTIKYLSLATSTFILRVAREHYRLVWAALAYITRLQLTPLDSDGAHPGSSYRNASDYDNRPCVLRVMRVTGTIKKAEEEIIRQARQDVLRVQREATAAAVAMPAPAGAAGAAGAKHSNATETASPAGPAGGSAAGGRAASAASGNIALDRLWGASSPGK